MHFKDYAFAIFPKTLGYNSSRLTSVNLCNPITLKFSITAACLSLRKTCQIEKQYKDCPHRVKNYSYPHTCNNHDKGKKVCTTFIYHGLICSSGAPLTIKPSIDGRQLLRIFNCLSAILR